MKKRWADRRKKNLSGHKIKRPRQRGGGSGEGGHFCAPLLSTMCRENAEGNIKFDVINFAMVAQGTCTHISLPALNVTVCDQPLHIYRDAPPSPCFYLSLKRGKAMDSELKVYKHPTRNCWFIADSFSGTILIDNCKSLDAAIRARQDLISRLQAALRRNVGSRALGFSWTPNCDENESDITRRCV